MLHLLVRGFDIWSSAVYISVLVTSNARLEPNILEAKSLKCIGVDDPSCLNHICRDASGSVVNDSN